MLRGVSIDGVDAHQQRRDLRPLRRRHASDRGGHDARDDRAFLLALRVDEREEDDQAA